jgi:diacylglycerol kinase family enzyme
MTSSVAVIVNESSGLGQRPERFGQVLKESGIEANIHVTSKGSDISGLASELYRSGQRTLVAVGGDGTIRAVASAIVDTEARLGILPAGTLNHFAKDLKLPLDLQACIQILKNGVVHSVDVAEVNGHIFLNNSGLGLYPAMVARREKGRALGQPKWIAMVRAAAATLHRFPFLDVRLIAAGQALALRTPFVFVGNNLYRMEGIRLGSRDSLTQGQLCVGIAQHRIGRWGLVRLAVSALLFGISGQRDLDILVTKEVRIMSRRKRVSVSLDGELARLETPLQYRILPSGLRVIAPEST